MNTSKTLELAKLRAERLGIMNIVVASETGLSAVKALDLFTDRTLIVVSSAAGTVVPDTPIGDLEIGLPDEEIVTELRNGGAKIVRGTDPFWNISAHIPLLDTGKLGMKFYEVICSGIHVCMSAVLEATDAGYLKKKEEVVALAGSWVGLDTAIVAKASNAVDFFDDFEVNEIICKPREAKYQWPIEGKGWRGNYEKYEKFATESEKNNVKC
ncbi:MAG: hypothetical protein ACLFVP_00590 [Candidatus Bathyarchaeia archaeon]